jgi:hypothetical protein
MKQRAEEPKDRPFEQLQKKANSTLKQVNVATTAAIRAGDPKGLVDSSLIMGARGASLTWAKEK